MPFGVAARVGTRALLLLTIWLAAACSGAGVFREYEYEEELYLALDGTVTVDVHASVAALVALRGADMNADPRARIDQVATRAFFEGPGVRATISLARRDQRRIVHARVQADSYEQLSRVMPFTWSTYRFDRVGEQVRFRQVVGPPAKTTALQEWTGNEIVRFRLHLPSEITFHNAPSGQVLRGNILEWQQSLADRLAGRPVEIEVHMEPESILYTTLLLFGATAVAAAVALALAVWWIAGRKGAIEEPPRAG